MDEVAKWFYTNTFPYETLCQLAELSGPLSKIEFVAECENYRKRYITANSADKLRREMLSHATLKAIHVGACYSHPPIKGATMQPVSKPLVLDIDLDGYYPAFQTADSSDMEANDAALPVVWIGMKVIEYFLVNCFGFDANDMLLVYSGRRGAHLHCFSPRASALTNESRAAIANWLAIHPPKSSGYVSPDGSDSNSRLRCSKILEHPNFADCFDQLIEPLFLSTVLKEKTLGGLGVLCSDSSVHQFLHFLDIRSAQEVQSLPGEVLAVTTAAERFKLIKERVTSFAASFKPPVDWPLERLKEVVMTYTWPRIDVPVTCDIGHTLKAPFVAHPKTGRICVPLLGDRTFDPATALSLEDPNRLANELPKLLAQTRAWIGAFKRRYAASTNSDIEDLVQQPPASLAAVPEDKLVRIVLALGREFAFKISVGGNIFMSTRLVPTQQPFYLNGDVEALKNQIDTQTPSDAVLVNKARQAYRRAGECGMKRSDRWHVFETMPTAFVLAEMPEARANVRAAAMLHRFIERSEAVCIQMAKEAETWIVSNRGVAFVDCGP